MTMDASEREANWRRLGLERIVNLVALYSKMAKPYFASQEELFENMDDGELEIHLKNMASAIGVYKARIEKHVKKCGFDKPLKK